NTCAQDVQDLESFARQRVKRRIPFWYGAIAAAVFLVIVSALLFSKRPPAQVSSLHDEAGMDSLPQREKEIARKALATGKLPLPAYLAEISPARETLMGEPPPENFHVISPVATAVRSQTPKFRWSSAGDASYTVTLQELGGGPAITSEPV